MLWVEPVLRAASWFATLAVLTLIAAVVLVLKAEVVALVDRLRVLASHDALTGALNRGAFEQRLEAELARSARTRRPCALAVLDLDHFKAVNDRLGHAGGDDALRLVASVVTDGLRRSRRLRAARRRGVRRRADGDRRGRRGRVRAAPARAPGRGADGATARR